MDLDVFVSYEHEAKSIADNLVSVLEASKIRCWYAPRDVIGDYATSIVEAIDKSKVFIIILSEKASHSPHVLNEVELAYKKVIENKTTIIPFKVDNANMSKAMEYYVKRLHWIDAVNSSLENAVVQLASKIKPILGMVDEHELSSQNKKRDKSKYFNSEREAKRLEAQTQLLLNFNSDLYDRVFSQYDSLCVLDLGSNNGENIMARFKEKKLDCLVGLEREIELVEESKENFPSENLHFYQADVEDDDIENILNSITSELKISGFNVINVSMLLLHLRNPFKLLRKLHRFLSEDGVMIIMDIDDGLNIGFPELNFDFDRIYSICDRNETSGFRRSGRQIPVNLKRAGYKEISLVKTGLNSLYLDCDAKESLFNTYFRLILNDVNYMAERYPENRAIKEDCEWYNGIFDELSEQFLSDEFFFSIGFMLFTAKK